MDTSSLSSLDGLTGIGLRGGVDMRPTLLRVLTDLYVQKLTHTPDEERHYTELALRLLEAVDVPTRVAVAARLVRQLTPPARVVQFLAGDLPEVAAALRPKPAVQAPGAATVAQRPAGAPIADAQPDHALDQRHDETGAATEWTASPSESISSNIAGELNELFFAANANERRLILLNLDVVASLPPGRAAVFGGLAVGQHLEAAALGRKHEDFAQQLARSLQVSHAQAQRIVRDELGEPVVVAAKTLGIPRDVLYRILLFVNTSVGHSVERVHALAELYDELTPEAAADMVAIWQALQKGDEHKATRHQPALWDDEARARARPTAMTAQRAPAAPRRSERRDAS
jgi:hypothetical protein